MLGRVQAINLARRLGRINKNKSPSPRRFHFFPPLEHKDSISAHLSQLLRSVEHVFYLIGLFHALIFIEYQ